MGPFCFSNLMCWRAGPFPIKKKKTFLDLFPYSQFCLDLSLRHGYWFCPVNLHYICSSVRTHRPRWGRRILKGRLHYVSPTQCAWAWMISYVCKFIKSRDTMDHTYNFPVWSYCWCRDAPRGGGNKKQNRSALVRPIAWRCVHVTLVGNGLAPKCFVQGLFFFFFNIAIKWSRSFFS